MAVTNRDLSLDLGIGSLSHNHKKMILQQNWASIVKKPAGVGGIGY